MAINGHGLISKTETYTMFELWLSVIEKSLQFLLRRINIKSVGKGSDTTGY